MEGIRTISQTGRHALGEGLLWSVREQALYWTDILSHRVHRLAADGRTHTVWQLDDHVGWIIERERGGFVAGIGRRFCALTLADDGTWSAEVLAAPEDGAEGNRFNDAKADRFGAIWAGSMDIGCTRPSGSFYRLDPQGTVQRIASGFTIPNGPAIGPDVLFHTDTARRTIFRHMLHDDGHAGPAEPYIVFADPAWGVPDGMCLDAEGGLWVACWDGGAVRRFTPDGTLDRTIALPGTQITNVCFGGPGLDRLFITSAADGSANPVDGALFTLVPGPRGLPANRYAG
ncbi:SMP-30/gluconolactonase/LRE family protein [Novosphingobium aerophilum]|uniref:SMP-30/gluconolactonase/LRE family protein n=1 Tax=Novosphingobium aerophilum TaxID=2839843 RepID=A0A7X1F6M5_9SPHN|nr:SMP-30/gluconolactonase/LRE family protein [Novosphingobium aerophilum]MBC2651323.1 SMP-30/gluconolactonase/LRE family protein [Novosphingobium aerophilum]